MSPLISSLPTLWWELLDMSCFLVILSGKFLAVDSFGGELLQKSVSGLFHIGHKIFWANLGALDHDLLIFPNTTAYLYAVRVGSARNEDDERILAEMIRNKLLKILQQSRRYNEESMHKISTFRCQRDEQKVFHTISKIEFLQECMHSLPAEAFEGSTSLFIASQWISWFVKARFCV